MLTVATHNRAAPYFAVTAGPDSHSPPPIADAPMTSPGPIMASQFFAAKMGASVSSPVVHCGICFEPGCGASNDPADEAGVCSVISCTLSADANCVAPALPILESHVTISPTAHACQRPCVGPEPSFHRRNRPD